SFLKSDDIFAALLTDFDTLASPVRRSTSWWAIWPHLKEAGRALSVLIQSAPRPANHPAGCHHLADPR
ncbi:MAG: hypothetical protein JKP90_23320, partial [Desulfofustis sp. PB-SRB1]|nr:hypothetical protein [Desulfofustis sp. PB-SRB1]